LFLVLLVSTGTLIQAKTNNLIDRNWDFGIGVGYGEISNPFFGGKDIPLKATIDFAVYGKRFFFDNGDLGFTFIEQPNFGLNLILTYNSERIYYSYFNNIGINVFNAGDRNIQILDSSPLFNNGSSVVATPINPILPSPPPPDPIDLLPLGEISLPFNIPDRDLSINLGLEAIISSEFGTLTLQAMQNIDNNHRGQDIKIEFSKYWNKKRWSFGPNIGMHWKSSKLLNYYYGLNNESNPFFDLAYEAGSGVDLLFGFKVNYRISNHLSLVSSISYNSLSSSIKNSPIIDSNHTQTTFVGLFYRF
jgi:outer membrane protein